MDRLLDHTETWPVAVCRDRPTGEVIVLPLPSPDRRSAEYSLGDVVASADGTVHAEYRVAPEHLATLTWRLGILGYDHRLVDQDEDEDGTMEVRAWRRC